MLDMSTWMCYLHVLLCMFHLCLRRRIPLPELCRHDCLLCDANIPALVLLTIVNIEIQPGVSAYAHPSKSSRQTVVCVPDDSELLPKVPYGMIVIISHWYKRQLLQIKILVNCKTPYLRRMKGSSCCGIF